MTDSEKETLHEVAKYARSYRFRQHAEALQAQERGIMVAQLAQHYGRDRDTISRWIHAWEDYGLAGLFEPRRPGRPPKLAADEKKKLLTALAAVAAPSRRWLVGWLLTAGLTVGARTLGRLLRAAGYVYKRVRRCLRPQRCQRRFDAAQRLLARLLAHQRAGRLRVWYTDECRFSRQAPLSRAWPRRGQRATPVPAVRGTGGYSMLGFWTEPAATAATAATATAATSCPASFHYWTSETAFTAELWVKAVEAWLPQQQGPTVLVLDNASIHRARLVAQCRPDWQARGLTLCYLPPYSPELNRIELLWHRFKHHWLAPADYADEKTLFQRINQIASQVNQKYLITSG